MGAGREGSKADIHCNWNGEKIFRNLRQKEGEEQSFDVPVIAISVSVAIIALICGIGIAIEIRDRRRKKQISRMSSTASRNPIVNRGRSIKESDGKLEEFDNPNYEKTPPFTKKENEEIDWDMVEMEDIDLNDDDPIDIVNIRLQEGKVVLQRHR